MRNTLSLAMAATLLLIGSGCAALHHVAIGQVDNTHENVAWIPFEVLVSESGVAIEEAGKIALATNTSGGDALGNVAAIIGLFQMGPRTGNPVYAERYAEKLMYVMHEKCPSGRITGLTSIREMRKYPVISGEIVKITGFCLKPKKESKS